MDIEAVREAPEQLRFPFAPRITLGERLEALRDPICRAAQRIYDDWTQDDLGYDYFFGFGGICDMVSAAIQELLGSVEEEAGLRSDDGGQEGDDHAFVVCWDAVDAYAVDIPSRHYETGGGYTWRKLAGVTFTPAMVVIEPIPREWVADRDTDGGEE